MTNQPRTVRPHPAPIWVSVIIPYYQREADILVGCLGSIAAQRLPANVFLDVLVVDDASPLPPEAATAAVAFDPRHQVRIIRRENGGPGAARNTGLDHVHPETAFVAFLDSDDRWRPEHLGRAIGALAKDGDFYFSDADWQETTWFSHVRFAERPDWASDFELIDAEAQTYAFPDGKAFATLVAKYVSHTSTVVFRHGRFADLRFDTALRYAGEDHQFWIALAATSRRVCFGRRATVARGAGVNMYDSAFGIRRSGFHRILVDNYNKYSNIRKQYELDPETSSVILREQIKSSRNLAVHILYMCWIKKSIDLSIMGWTLKNSPELFWRLPFEIPRVLGARVLESFSRRPAPHMV